MKAIRFQARQTNRAQSNPFSVFYRVGFNLKNQMSVHLFADDRFSTQLLSFSLLSKQSRPFQQRSSPELKARKKRSDNRCLQKNLVYTINMPLWSEDQSILKKDSFFGKYGKVTNAIASIVDSARTNIPNSKYLQAYITYQNQKDAALDIAVKFTIISYKQKMSQTVNKIQYIRYKVQSNIQPANEAQRRHLKKSAFQIDKQKTSVSESNKENLKFLMNQIITSLDEQNQEDLIRTKRKTQCKREIRADLWSDKHFRQKQTPQNEQSQQGSVQNKSNYSPRIQQHSPSFPWMGCDMLLNFKADDDSLWEGTCYIGWVNRVPKSIKQKHLQQDSQVSNL